jgi:hypothetical protein
MARKAAKKQQTDSSTGGNRNEEVEASVIALAEQLGTFLGQVTAKAEGWLDNDTLRQQATMIREGADAVLKRVSKAGTTAKQTAKAAKETVTNAVKSTRAAAPAEAQPRKARPKGSNVDAPGKKHRKPPPQEHITRGTTDPMGKRQGLKTYKVGSGRRG